ncbi:MAG: 30S ribosomal protein S15 [Candidatus Babeliaceae bacterium]|nr:30S ribosomal protein S15 [Candidatus Babeliaceae bacterium]
MITREEKKKLIEQYGRHGSDVGSAEVQVACITERINMLNKHFGQFPHDFASRTGLMKLVGRRRRLLDYLKRCDQARYDSLIKRLGIRR